MKLSRILREGVDITYVDEEEDWETVEQIDQAFLKSRIRVSRDMKPLVAASVNGEVVGGVYVDWKRDYDTQSHVFEFDVAVMPGSRGHGAGLKLIEAAIREYESSKGEYDRTMMRLNVINPKLVRVLERKYGFEIDVPTYGGAAYMVRY